jgi:hypothetical protein
LFETNKLALRLYLRTIFQWHNPFLMDSDLAMSETAKCQLRDIELNGAANDNPDSLLLRAVEVFGKGAQSR